MGQSSVLGWNCVLVDCGGGHMNLPVVERQRMNHTHRHRWTAFAYGGTDLKDKDSEPWELQTLNSALPLRHMATTVQARLC